MLKYRYIYLGNERLNKQSINANKNPCGQRTIRKIEKANVKNKRVKRRKGRSEKKVKF